MNYPSNYDLEKLFQDPKYRHVLENHVGQYPTDKVLRRLAGLISRDLAKIQNV